MIALLAVSVLVGTWTCTSPDAPRSRFVYTFARNGTGSFAQVEPAALRSSKAEHFTYSVSERGVFMQSPGAAPVMKNIVVHGNVLEEQGYFYQNADGEWLVPSNWNRYRCSRAIEGERRRQTR
jgi:hypothetical protein